MAFFTLLCRHNLTLASDVCEAALRSLFRTLNELNELPDLFGLYVLFSQFKPRDVLKGIFILSFRKLYMHKHVNKKTFERNSSLGEHHIARDEKNKTYKLKRSIFIKTDWPIKQWLY